MRFVISPNEYASEFATFKDMLPTIQHSEEIVLTTDKRSTLLSDVEARLPAKGLRPPWARLNVTATYFSRNRSNSDALEAIGEFSGTSRKNSPEMNPGDSLVRHNHPCGQSPTDVFLLYRSDMKKEKPG
jgi:hypothetical protein